MGATLGVLHQVDTSYANVANYAGLKFPRVLVAVVSGESAAGADPGSGAEHQPDPVVGASDRGAVPHEHGGARGARGRGGV